MKARAFSGSPVRLERPVLALVFSLGTTLLVIAFLCGMAINAPLILLILVTGVVLLGLPHGALDPRVARQLFAGTRRFTMARFLLGYILLAGACIAGWLAAPNLALCIFLLISAVHFGSDWGCRGSAWGRTAYGACIVSVPALRHAEAVRQIYGELGATAASGIVHVSSLVAIAAVTVAFVSLIGQIRLRWQDCLELTVIVLGALALPPLAFFTCYFCLLHSPRHLLAAAGEVGLRSLPAIAAAVAPMVVATLLLAALVWRFLPAKNLTGHVLEIVFIGLAALTVPHMFLTGIKEFRQKNTHGLSYIPN